MSNFWNKRIPTVVGLLLLTVAVLATSYLVNTGVIYFGKAAPTDTPENVRVTNISDTTLTITYQTETQVIGTVSIGTSKDSLQTVLDERDELSGVPKEYFLHSIAVKNLKPETSYIFSITSRTTTYQNGQTAFTTQTYAPLVASPSATLPFSGKLLSPSGSNLAESILFVTTSGGQMVSTVAKSTGVYLLPLNALRTTDGTRYIPLQESSVMQVLATDGKNTTQAQIIIANANPVPPMILGNNYNFVLSRQPIASTAANLGFPPFPQSNLSATPIITVPQKDEGFSDSQPKFSGKALPNQPVTIEIHSVGVVQATVTSDSSGNWTYRPTTPLSPGLHTITISSKNAAGILQTIEQSFVVYASGSTVSQSATPSGQLSPTPTLVVTATPTIKVSPTIVLSPTSVVSPTSLPTGQITRSLTPRPTLPPTGSNALLVSGILGIVTTLTGVVLFIFTKGI